MMRGALLKPLQGMTGRHTTEDAASSRTQQAWQVIDTTKMRVVLLGLVVVLGLVYLWLVNSTATAGFYLSDLSTQQVMLEEEYKKLELEQASLRSLEHVQGRSAEMNMVVSAPAEYIDTSTTVALGAQ